MAPVSASLNLPAVFSSLTTSRRQPSRVSCASRDNSSSVATNSQASLYQVLGIPMGATADEIKTAYRRLARVLHPDVNGGGGEDTAATDDFISIHEAYTILRDPKKRADYDRSLFRQRRTARSPWVLSAGKSYTGYVCRNWETDQCW